MPPTIREGDRYFTSRGGDFVVVTGLTTGGKVELEFHSMAKDGTKVVTRDVFSQSHIAVMTASKRWADEVGGIDPKWDPDVAVWEEREWTLDRAGHRITAGTHVLDRENRPAIVKSVALRKGDAIEQAALKIQYVWGHAIKTVRASQVRVTPEQHKWVPPEKKKAPPPKPEKKHLTQDQKDIYKNIKVLPKDLEQCEGFLNLALGAHNFRLEQIDGLRTKLANHKETIARLKAERVTQDHAIVALRDEQPGHPTRRRLPSEAFVKKLQGDSAREWRRAVKDACTTVGDNLGPLRTLRWIFTQINTSLVSEWVKPGLFKDGTILSKAKKLQIGNLRDIKMRMIFHGPPRMKNHKILFNGTYANSVLGIAFPNQSTFNRFRKLTAKNVAQYLAKSKQPQPYRLSYGQK